MYRPDATRDEKFSILCGTQQSLDESGELTNEEYFWE